MDAQMRAVIDRRRKVMERLKAVVIDDLNLELNSDEIAEDAPLFGVGLGLDSIDALQLIVGIEEAFGISIPSDDIAVYRSMNTLADYIIENQDEERGENTDADQSIA